MERIGDEVYVKTKQGLMDQLQEFVKHGMPALGLVGTRVASLPATVPGDEALKMKEEEGAEAGTESPEEKEELRKQEEVECQRQARGGVED